MDPNINQPPSIFNTPDAVTPANQESFPPAEFGGTVAGWDQKKAHHLIATKLAWVTMVFVMLAWTVLFIIDINANDRAVHDAWDRLQIILSVGFAAVVGWLYPKR